MDRLALLRLTKPLRGSHTSFGPGPGSARPTTHRQIWDLVWTWSQISVLAPFRQIWDLVRSRSQIWPRRQSILKAACLIWVYSSIE